MHKFLQLSQRLFNLGESLSGREPPVDQTGLRLCCADTDHAFSWFSRLAHNSGLLFLTCGSSQTNGKKQHETIGSFHAFGISFQILIGISTQGLSRTVALRAVHQDSNFW